MSLHCYGTITCNNMPGFSKQRINRVFKRSGPSQKPWKPRTQPRPAPESPIPSEDEVPMEGPEDDSDSDVETRNRPYNTLLNILEINPEREGRSRKRRRITKEAVPSQSGSEEHDSTSEATDEIEDESASEEGDEQLNATTNESFEVEEEIESDAEDVVGDPFEMHLNAPDALAVTTRVTALQGNGWSISKRSLGTLGDCTIYSPKDTKLQNELLGIKDLGSEAGIKHKFVAQAEMIEGRSSIASKALSPYVFGYSDILFGGRTPQNSASIRDVTCLHVLNHVFKTRDKVVRHNAKLSAAGEDSAIQYRDQGFTRPKVLFLVPTRGACGKILDSIVELSAPEQQENRKRFEDNFYSPDGEVSADRPDDFKDLFDGNDDDMFRIGIKFTRKTVKFFTQFYNSDIILASPLGLRSAIDGGE